MIAAVSAALVAAAALAAPAAAQTVTTQYGDVKGFLKTTGSISALAWEGIPYAAAPVGDLRWAPTAEPPVFNSTFEATSYGPGCPQHCDLPQHTCPTATDEDCLFLNIYAPSGSDSSSSLPVMVWIHGGHFDQGSGEGPLYDGVAFASYENVVLVAINYRLGALGFLRDTGSGGVSGNFAVQDQIAALYYVKNNIAAFGGNPDEVTIFGQSAGGTSVSVLLTSPKATGLFKRVIIESNPIGLPLMAEAEGNALAGRFYSDAGCASGDLSCLRALPVETVLDAEYKAAKHLRLGDILEAFYEWVPAIDGVYITDEPLNLMMKGQINQAEVVAGGSVQNEGAIFIAMALKNATFSHLEYDAIIGATFIHDLNALKVLKYYPGSSDSDHNKAMLAKVATDYLFRCPLREAMRGMGAATTTYQYLFNHTISAPGSWGQWDYVCGPQSGNVCHASELVDVFRGTQEGILVYSAAEKVLAANMNAAWTSFAKSSAPGTSPDWPAYTSSNNATYLWEAGGQQSVITNMQQEICDVWREIGYRF